MTPGTYIKKAGAMVGRGNKGEEHYEVQTLQARHREILRLKMLGEDNKTIASRLGISTVNVSQVLNSQVAVNHMEKLQGIRDEQAVDMNERLVELSTEALAFHEKILRGEGEEGKRASISLRSKVAGEIMDRAGFGKTSNVNIKSQNMHVTADDLDEIKKRAEERKRLRVESESVVKPSQVLRLQSAG